MPQMVAVTKAAPLDQAEINKTVDSLALNMQNLYVFPDKGKETSDLLKKNHKAGVYKDLSDPMKLAEKLTQDILSIAHDKHVSVWYDPRAIAMMKEDKSKKTDEFEKQEAYQNKKDNHGFQEVKILKGNVGYLKLNSFGGSHEAFETAVGAMAFLANADAIVIDLRDNGGGNATMIQLLSSYFFDEKDVRHLNSFFHRATNDTSRTYTLPYVSGKRLPDCDLYILTSKFTFSAAEEFTYNLKNMKRATIVGETTGGGGHTVTRGYITDNYMLQVATGKAINPITKTNWEGVGVKPDYEVTREQALDKAILLAYEKLAAKEVSPIFKTVYQWALEEMKAKEHPTILDKATMESYTGTFGQRTLFIENDELYYQREGRPKMKMIPISQDKFIFKEAEHFRLRIIKENDKVVALEGNYNDGRIDRNEKNK